MIDLKEALQIVLDSAQPLGTERVELRDALDRILAEDVTADMDLPPFDKATVDGYACRRADLGHPLTVVETIPAGRMPEKAIGPDQCAKIMTGAAVPQGADCVVLIEQTEQVGPTEVPDRGESVRPLRSEVMLTLFRQAPMPSPRREETVIRFTGEQTPDHVFRRATDIRAGQVVLPEGSRVGPPHVAVLASVGCVRPLVAKRPRVGVIASGDELVPPAARPGPSQIRNSNGSQLIAQLAALGLKARDYGIVKDAAREIDAALKIALADNDVVIISAGVSVGDFDLVPAALQRNGVKLRFEKIAVRPGKPTVCGVRERGYCFGLPGNPVSTFVVFELLVKPFLYRLMGHDYRPRYVQMRLEETVARKDSDRQSWIPVRITSEETVQPVQYHGSAHLSALCDAGGLMPMEIGVTSIEPGTPVRVRLL
ncbi:MAG: molybdopterin molybdotransferase MoeA [Planctomycetes bacterium]|nr:molybdopterin molybdotransferase MoeA [Planctomycetota bacterium]